MPPLKAIRACIDAIGGKAAGSRTRVARRLHVTPGYITNLYDGDRNPSGEVALALVREARASGLDVGLNEVAPDIYPLSALAMFRPEK